MTPAAAMKYADIKCGLCGVEWPTHSSEHCPHGRKPVEPVAEPEVVRPRKRELDLWHAGIVYQAVEAQLKIIERRLRRWTHWDRWSYSEIDRSNDEYTAKVLRTWLEKNR